MEQMVYPMTMKRTITNIIKRFKNSEKTKTNKRIIYYELATSFDIETTSFKVQSTELPKRAIMYIWQFAINDIVIYGRTWEEFTDLLDILVTVLELNHDKRLIIYVHNLSYEFQFMCRHFIWEKVFSLEERKPVKAELSNGIEFRCSYKLSGYSLAKLSDQLTKYKVKKMSGDLDYNMIRTPLTTLTDKEMQYCINDVLVVTAYIREYIERVGSITKIPLTKTGAVRDLARRYCFYGNPTKRNQDTYKRYRKFIETITLTSEQYALCKQAFAGGFTHAAHVYVGETLKNVHSKDFTSAYPYVMLAEKFPMTTPKKVNVHTEKEALRYLHKYCCIFRVCFRNIKEKFKYDHYISKSKCEYCKDSITDNGRVVQSTELAMTVTELDFMIIKATYDYEACVIQDFYIMEKAYLPTNYVKAILDLYETKTTLKGIEGKEVEYLVSKENLNSMYGMTVTDICRDEIVYNMGNWSKDSPDIEKAIHSYNTSKKRFLSYPWGIYVTAYCRYNLWTAILELGEDYVYSDTDSVKYLNWKKHEEYFNNYNNGVLYKLNKALEYHKIPLSRCKPKNKKGEEQMIGVWDDEGSYTRFKTLGAKRYMTEKGGKINITVSGLSKQDCVPYLLEKYGDNVFDAFDNELYIPPEYTGKKIHTYIDDEVKGTLVDYQGNTYEYDELSGIHLGDCDYHLSMSPEFLKYLFGISKETYE